VAIHFWAPWNGYDPVMDRAIQAVAKRFADRVHFVSCNIDLEENVELCRRFGVVNVPSLGLLVSGMTRRVITGCRAPEDLVSEIESRFHERESKPWWAFWKRLDT
jgi:thiol-disulfide isomerase/thioredoxin